MALADLYENTQSRTVPSLPLLVAAASSLSVSALMYLIVKTQVFEVAPISLKQREAGPSVSQINTLAS